MPINPKYFQTVITRTEGTVNYSVVRPLGNPMVMFSEVDGTALCAFHITCTDSDSAKAIITKRPVNLNEVDADFQGIIDTDNQSVAFVVTNLTDRFLSFSIKRNDVAINEVNALSAYESYEIKCDKSDSRGFVLKTTVDSSNQKVSVKESEKSKTHEKLGTYLDVTFYPENNPILVEKFEKTVWKCVDLFWMIEMVKPKVALGVVHEPMFGGGMRPSAPITSNRGDVIEPAFIGYTPEPFRPDPEPSVWDRITSFFGSSSSNNEVFRPSGRVLESRAESLSVGRRVPLGGIPFGESTRETGLRNMCATMPMSRNVSRAERTNMVSGRYNERDGEIMERAGGKEIAEEEVFTERTKIIPESAEIDCIDDEEDNECFEEMSAKIPQSAEVFPERGFHDTFRTLPKTVDELRPTCKPKGSYEQAENKKTINESKIAHIEKGKHIEVKTKSVSIDISYKTPSVKCKIALSVHETLVVKTVDASVFTEKANEILDDLITNIDKKDLRLLFLIEKVYSSDICAICRDEHPDTLIYQCGHQCCHFDCGADKMVKCPVCRMIIGGFVKLSVEA